MATIAAVVLVVAAIVTVVLASGDDPVTAWQGGNGTSSAPTPTSASGQQPSSSSSAGGNEELPPPTPTGKPYSDRDPQVGDCVDLARKTGGVSIYQAKCDNSDATLILESVQPKDGKCDKGHFGLNSLSDGLLCFTFNFKKGHCIDMAIPRRTSCDDTPGATPGPPKVTVLEVRVGQRDGTGCQNPNTIFQVGKGDQRGVACLAPARANASTTPPPPR